MVIGFLEYFRGGRCGMFKGMFSNNIYIEKGVLVYIYIYISEVIVI